LLRAQKQARIIGLCAKENKVVVMRGSVALLHGQQRQVPVLQEWVMSLRREGIQKNNQTGT
jgi:hypothetical protein